MFDFQQVPSRTGGTIAVLDDGNTFSQVAFHAGTDNFDQTFLRISASILTHAAGTKVERFSMQYESSWHQFAYYDDVVLENDVVQAAWEARHAA